MVSTMVQIPLKMIAPDFSSHPLNLNQRMKNTKATEDARRLVQVDRAITYARDVCLEHDQRTAKENPPVRNLYTPVVVRN